MLVQNADKEIAAKLEMMFFLQKEELASLPFAVLGLRIVKTLLHLMDWADVTRFTQPQCLDVFVILKNFGIVHNEEFIELWRSSPELREKFGEDPVIFTSRLATEDGLKEHLPDLHHRIALYLGIDCSEDD